MVQGTGSDVGKSLLVTGLCRALTRRGIRVRPFKPQNMSNNAAVTADGGEIGRAQALQARACGVAPSVHMNPVLLKPTAEVGAQVVVQGRVTANADARAYHRMKPSLMSPVLESFARLRGEADLVLVEGAGSPAETNLREGDIANMGFALTARVPVVLVADIERGGVLASLVGTHALLEPAERDMVAGYVVNKFRGDPSLFDPAIMEIGGRTGWRCFGVLPFLEAARRLPQEDAMALESAPLVTTGKTAIRIAVPRLARIANFDDLDPLAAEADVRVRILQPGEALPAETDLVLLPGTKATLSDLAYLREQGWDVDILAHHRRGGLVVGLCGGYQMLGRSVADPGGAEGPAGEAPGLGLLDIDTVLGGDKTLRPVEGKEAESGQTIRGYEMHMGETTGPGLARSWVQLADGRKDGAVSSDGRVRGTYLHGLFAADGFRRAFLDRLYPGRAAGPAYDVLLEDTLNALADHLVAHLDVDALLNAAKAPSS